MRRFLQMALASLREASIEEAGDGVQALRLLTENRYDLVLLDLNLPLLDPFPSASRLRTRRQIDFQAMIRRRRSSETCRRFERNNCSEVSSVSSSALRKLSIAA